MNFPRTPTLTIRAKDPAKPVPKQRTWRQLDKEGRDTSVIGAEPVEVPNNRYYRRRVVTGDAELVAADTGPVDPADRWQFATREAPSLRKDKE